jgi:cytochrome c oxidase subunit 2
MTNLACLLLAETSNLDEHKISSIFHPLSTPAQNEFNYALLVIAICGGIFVVVATLLIFTMIRFRRKPDGGHPYEPPQVYGSNRIEAAWTVLPVLIVFVLAGVTARVVWGIGDASQPKSTLHVEVTGHQYWWEVRYPNDGVVTANEIHIPVSHDRDHASFFDLKSSDVIHSLWIPELGGKTDLIPGRANHMWMDPKEAGVYWGNCTEFCGAQHANMLVQVVAQEPADFERWLTEQRQPHVSDPQALAGEKKFQMFACGGCHAVQGTKFKGRLGPDLTHVMSRRLIGSGVLPNTADNRKAWISNPQDAKPGCLMPGMKLSGKNLDDLNAFMETLK